MPRLHAITEFGRRALTAVDIASTMREAMELARFELGVERCETLAFLPAGEVELLAACDSLPVEGVNVAVNVAPDSLAGQVLRRQSPVAIEDLQTDDGLLPTYLPGRRFGGSLCVPIYGPDRLLGVISVYCLSPREFIDDEIDFLQTLAHLASLLVQRNIGDEQRRTQRMLRAEQMMAIGQVAAGVAHELRNPLTSIKGLVQVNLRESLARGLPSDDLAVIEHEIRRMERTLQTFLDFARPPLPNRQKLNLANVVQRVLALVLGRAQKQHVTITLTEETHSAVCADEDQLQQLFLNLALNALDAMPDGGSIEVILRAAGEEYVDAIIRDNGSGIHPDILPKVFETFVSSKETGVGLGLAVSQRIAERHGGTLTVHNLPGGGACFTLRLPVGG